MGAKNCFGQVPEQFLFTNVLPTGFESLMMQYSKLFVTVIGLMIRLITTINLSKGPRTIFFLFKTPQEKFASATAERVLCDQYVDKETQKPHEGDRIVSSRLSVVLYKAGSEPVRPVSRKCYSHDCRWGGSLTRNERGRQSMRLSKREERYQPRTRCYQYHKLLG